MRQLDKGGGDEACKPVAIEEKTPDGKIVHSHIGKRLRRMFDEVVQEPIPDKFKALLDDLEKSAKK